MRSPRGATSETRPAKQITGIYARFSAVRLFLYFATLQKPWGGPPQGSWIIAKYKKKTPGRKQCLNPSDLLCRTGLRIRSPWAPLCPYKLCINLKNGFVKNVVRRTLEKRDPGPICSAFLVRLG